jgi:hypothetical protein
MDIVRPRGGLPALLLGLAACAAAPPTFSVEPAAQVASSRGASRSLYVGYRSTPPPGHYRFARVYEDGRVEARELYAVNGPGPWLAYESDVAILTDSARELFRAVDATLPGSAPADDREACVLAVASPSGITWRGCAYPTIAARALAIVPTLGPPEIGPSCTAAVCQIRLVDGAPALTHDRYGKTTRDLVLDASGAFWCAASAGQQRDQPNTLRVLQGRIRPADAPAVWQWLVGDSTRHKDASEPRSSAEPAIHVQIRGVGDDWTAVPSSAATALISRWTRIAPRLPAPCRP